MIPSPVTWATRLPYCALLIIQPLDFSGEVLFCLIFSFDKLKHISFLLQGQPAHRCKFCLDWIISQMSLTPRRIAKVTELWSPAQCLVLHRGEQSQNSALGGVLGGDFPQRHQQRHCAWPPLSFWRLHPNPTLNGRHLGLWSPQPRSDPQKVCCDQSLAAVLSVLGPAPTAGRVSVLSLCLSSKRKGCVSQGRKP